MDPTSNNLIEALRNPAIWPDQPDEVDCIETHISWVLLTRDFAWKIKKPVKFEFLDFSSLELRKHFCEEELRLNRRTASSLYQDVVPICGDASAPVIGRNGAPFEFAVKMFKFDESRLLSRMAIENRITPAMIDALAESISAFHSSIPSAGSDSKYGRPEDIRRDALDNFSTIGQPSNSDNEQIAALHKLRDWTVAEADYLTVSFEQRRADGFIRECHGDLHLRNIVELDEGPCLFDCVEFNEGFRWIDVISEIAFLMMDLEEHGLEMSSRRFLNRYLERTGDYAGLDVLRFYLVYRAMVRAKVDMIRLQKNVPTHTQRRLLQQEFGGYVSVADHDATQIRPALIIMHGFSGSGKTKFSQRLIENTPTIRLRSDVERKRIHGIEETTRVTGTDKDQLYSPQADHRTYRYLEALAGIVIECGFPVVVDATFLQRAERARFRSLAERLDVPFRIVACSARNDVLLARVAAREFENNDASDAGLATLRRQMQSSTAIESEPHSQVVAVDTSIEESTTGALRLLCDILT